MTREELTQKKQMFPTGIEPAHPASEARALSTELRELSPYYTIPTNDSQVFFAQNHSISLASYLPPSADNATYYNQSYRQWLFISMYNVPNV